MKLKEYFDFDNSTKDGTYFYAKITRSLNDKEVAPEYLGKVIKVTTLVARKGVGYGNLEEIKARPIDPNKPVKKTNWVSKAWENKLSYAKDGKTILVWLYTTKNSKQKPFVRYIYNGKETDKSVLIAKNILKPQPDKKEAPLLMTVKLENLSFSK